MKRILLVDDDFLSLNAFYALTDWNRIGVQIAYEAHNGREALEYMEKTEAKPDAAFIDVCMPDMDGIVLLQQFRKRYPQMLCFMLSGYSDYPYVRETLKMGAKDYLLKYEMTSENIVKLLMDYGCCAAQTNGPTRDEQLLLGISGQKVENMTGYLLCARYMGSRPLIDAQGRSILQTCRHIFNDMEEAIICSPALDMLILFINTEKNAAVLPQVQKRLSMLIKALSKYHNTLFEFTQPCFCSTWQEIREVVRLARETEMVQPQSGMKISKATAMLALAVANHKKNAVKTTMQTLFAEAEREQEVDVLINRLSVLLFNLRQNVGIRTNERDAPPLDAKQAAQYFIDRFTQLCDKNGESRFSPIINEAIDYLYQHYAEDIHLSDVAKHCCLSYAHLSFLFKKETGDNLISTLNRIRVYHAAQALLMENAPASAVYEQAGFNGYNRYVQIFKTVSGKTPTEFRKSPDALNWLLAFQPIREIRE